MKLRHPLCLRGNEKYIKSEKGLQDISHKDCVNLFCFSISCFYDYQQNKA